MDHLGFISVVVLCNDSATIEDDRRRPGLSHCTTRYGI